MRKTLCLSIYVLACTPAFSQDWQTEIFLGTTGYSGDLNENNLQFRTMGPAINFNLKYRLGNQFYIRTGLAWGMTSGNDKYNIDSSRSLRNLSFQTTVTEFNLGVEYLLLPPDLFDRSYPYVFAGIGVFRFNPKAKDMNNDKIELQPLSTEGQGLPEYPHRKEYNRIQYCIPMGGGVTFTLSENLNISGEIGFRKLFTDYLDDVSTTYPDNTVLANRKGSTAAKMSYRGLYNHTQNTLPPPEGTIRGNPEKKDWYSFLGVKLSWNFWRLNERADGY